MRVWVDQATGTYGDIDTLVIIDVPDEILEAWDFGQASDSEIAETAGRLALEQESQ